MKKFDIFLDESGMIDLKEIKRSPYFTFCGVVLNEENRKNLRKDLDELKVKHFKTKSYIIHSLNLRKDLKTKEKIDNFANDIEKLIKKNPFFLLYSIVDKEKAIKYSWTNKTSYKKTYRAIIGNLIKFLIAKNAMGSIYAEASNIQQDLFLYESFFHFISNGIPKISIKPEDVKKHLTSVSFVTKLNNDPEEQIADLLGYCGIMRIKLLRDQLKENSLDKLDRVLLKIIEKGLFKGSNAFTAKKIKLYKEIDSFTILP